MKVHVLGALALVVIAASSPLRAQSIGDRIKQRVQDKMQERIDALTDSATDAALEHGEKSIRCLATDRKCIDKVSEAGAQVVLTDEKGKPLPDQVAAAKKAGVPASVVAPKEAAATSSTSETAASSNAAPAAAPPGQGVWLNYDFVPGDRTIYTEDFSGNEVGDFPRRMRLQEGNMEVVKVKDQMMLRSVKGGSFYVKLPERLPSRFTVEVRLHSPLVNPMVINTTSSSFERSSTIGCYSNKAFVDANHSGSNSGDAYQSDAPEGFVNCTFTVDNARGIKGYIDEHRTANAPQDSVVLNDTLFFELPSSDESDPFLLASIRVAAGGKKLYDVLAAKGRVSTQGIFFDTGSDHIRPESTPTLKEIGEMLTEHPTLKLTIEGHTDNVGSAASNMTLSDRRAAAVKQYLVSTYKVDATRLDTKGLGATKPVAPNTTPEGRQNNRRVELVKK